MQSYQLARRFAQVVERSGDHTALVDASSGRTLSYQQLALRAQAFVDRLADYGVGLGSNVMLWTPTSTDWFALIIALDIVGANALHVNTRYRESEVANIITLADPALIVICDRFLGIPFANILNSESIASRCPVWDLNAPEVAAAGQQVTEGAPPAGATGSEGIERRTIFGTSGTTSLPKLVVHSNEAVTRHAQNVARTMRIDRDAVLLLSLPTSGVFGFSGALAALLQGATTIFQPWFQADKVVDLMRQWKVSHYYGPDTMLRAVIDISDGQFDGWKDWRYGIIANFGGQVEQVAGFIEERCGVKLVGVYGSSETMGLACLGRVGDCAQLRWHSSGVPVADDILIRVVDPETNQPLKVGESGEIQWKGYNVLESYLGDPAGASKAFTEDGWFKSEDLGVVCENGLLTYVGRLRDSIRIHGYLVDPVEIEEIIGQHRGVKGVQVVGATDAAGKAHIWAFLLVDQEEFEGLDAVNERLKTEMAKYKIPTFYEIVEEFPVVESHNGRKVQKSILRERAESMMLKKGLP